MRALLALSLVVLVTAGGCRMCASPYDYCGPVLEDGCTNCDMGNDAMPARAGSPEEISPMMQKPSGQQVPANMPPATPKPAISAPNSSMPGATPAASRPSSPNNPVRSAARSTNSRFAYGDPNAQPPYTQPGQSYQH